MAWVILENKQGERRKVAPGENFGAEWNAVDIDEDPSPPPDPEDVATQQMLKEIEAELGAESSGTGDWIASWAKGVAAAMGKADCLSCEFRQVTFNAGKKLRRLHGPIKGQMEMMSLIRRSATEDTDKLAAELKALLEEK
jgi:hypothetical protein